MVSLRWFICYCFTKIFEPPHFSIVLAYINVNNNNIHASDIEMCVTPSPLVMTGCSVLNIYIYVYIYYSRFTHMQTHTCLLLLMRRLIWYVQAGTSTRQTSWASKWPGCVDHFAPTGVSCRFSCVLSRRNYSVLFSVGMYSFVLVCVCSGLVCVWNEIK